MKLIRLKPIDLLYSNVEENEGSVWDSSTTYNKGDVVVVTDITPHRYFESLIDSNTGNYPPDTCWFDLEDNYPEWDKKTTYDAGDRVKVTLERDGITPRFPQAFESLTNDNKGNYPPEDTTNWKSLDKWRDLGATNRYRMFDQFVNTQTENTDESGEAVIEVVVSFPYCDTFCLFNLDATSVEWYLYDGAYDDPDNLVASGTIDNLQEPVGNWYDYFFSDIIMKKDLYVSNLPIYGNGQLKVVIKKQNSVRCGLLVVGRSQYLGDTLFEPHISILDYSTKEVDENGNVHLQQGVFAKEIECDIWLNTGQVDIVRKILADVRATPCVFDFSNASQPQKESLIIYGFYKDFDIIISDPVVSSCSIRVEGLV